MVKHTQKTTTMMLQLNVLNVVMLQE